MSPSPSRSTRTRSPPVAGRYVLLDVIGAGAMGTVHLARDLRTGRHVAVKVLRGDGGDGEPLLRFVREQSLRIAHPHVLAPLGWAAEDDVVLLVTDVVAGGSLERLVRLGPLPERFVAVLLAQLLEALVAVHAAGVVHRDVKAANLLLEPTGTGRPHLLLGDFGVAAVPGDGPTRGGVGTDGYLSPEALAGAPPAPAQDLYAAGVVVHRALRGDLGSLAPVVSALLHDDPRDRPPSAAAALDMLRSLVDLDAASPWDTRAMPEVADVVHRVGARTDTPCADRRGTSRLSSASTACLIGSAALSTAALVVRSAAAIVN